MKQNLANATASYADTPILNGIQFPLSIAVSASVEAFNSPDDKDADGVIGPAPKPAAASDFEVDMSPQIIQTNDHVWLKYRYEVEPKVSATVPLSPATIKVNGDVNAVFTDFHVHNPTDNTLEALESDLQVLRFVGDPNDILKLNALEAVSYRVTATLTASVTITWSDIFSANLAALTSLLRSSKLLAIDVTAGVSTTISIQVLDDFDVVFTRYDPERIKLAVKKSDSRTINASLDAQISAQFGDSSQVQQVLDNIINSVTGQTMSVIDGILAKATLSNLTDAEKAIASELAQLLGLSPLQDDLSALKAKWDKFENLLENTTKAIATAKVQAGFAYEYARIRTDDTLLEAVLNASTLQACHNDLMLCSLDSVLDSVRAGRSQLISYINQTTVETKQAWGFSLNIGPWLAIGGTDKINITKVVQRDIDNNQRMAYTGVRKYAGVLGKWKEVWVSDFKAQMPSFAIRRTPT
ncbi:MAG: hypothetical protein ACREAC_08815, partial [Blastocatellia bacterium]